MKKEVRIEVDSWEKYRDKDRDKGEFENGGQNPLGGDKGAKKLGKFFFEKSVDKSSFTATWTL